MLEIEQATTNIEAQSRLSQLRAELGLDGGAAPTPAAVAPGSAGAISAAPADAGSVPVTEDQPPPSPAPERRDPIASGDSTLRRARRGRRGG